MNIPAQIELIFNANQWDDYTKIRFIYLFVCDNLSYDARFNLSPPPSLKKEIYEKTVDIKNVEDFEVICYTMSKILRDVLDYFGYEARVERENSQYGHAYVVVKYGKYDIILDSTKRHDTARVKSNLPTYDFRTESSDPLFLENLSKADESIKKSTDVFRYIKDRDTMGLIEFLASSPMGADPNTLLLNKINAIATMMASRKDLTRYDDADYLLSYLIKKSGLDNEVRAGVFVNVEDETWRDIITIILVEPLGLPSLFYIMEKVDGHYQIRESNSEEVLNKLEIYSNWEVNEYFKNKAICAKFDPAIL